MDDIEPIAIALHKAWGKAAPWNLLSVGMKRRYRTAAQDFLAELQKANIGIYYTMPRS